MSASQPSRFAPSPSQSRPRTEFVFEPLLDSDEAAHLLRIYLGISDAPAWWIALAILWRSFEAGHSSSGCRSSTTSWNARSSAN
jgi:hypothetical protein